MTTSSPVWDPRMEVATELHAAYIRFSQQPVENTVSVMSSLSGPVEIMVDLDKDGRLVGVEILG